MNSEKNQKKIIVLSTGLILLLFFSGCSLPGEFFLKPSEDENSQVEPSPEPLRWDQVKSQISDENPSEEDILKLATAVSEHYFEFDQSDVPEIISYVNSSNNSEIKLYLLRILKPYLSDNRDVFQLFFNVAASDDYLLAPEAFGALVLSEVAVDDNGQDQWDTWRWSNEVNFLLEQAVDEDLYKLPGLGYDLTAILLRLFDRYPNSKLTEGSRLYGMLTGGETYIGAYSDLPDDETPPVLRTPFNLRSELEFWPTFLNRYEGHPVSDDVMYRVARIHELNGDYSKAFLSYYEASQVPDGALAGVAKGRALFIADLLMDSSLLRELQVSVSHKELIPFLKYSAAVHLIRENNLSEAIIEIEEFVSEYKNGIITGLIPIYVYDYEESAQIDANSNFWNNVERQINNLKKLVEIRDGKETDKSIYEEAAFWFHNELTAYNYFWRGQQSSTFGGFLPSEWEGIQTSTKRLLKYDMVDAAGEAHDQQDGHLTSIKLCQKLLNSYPNSRLREKAMYTIVLNYYWLQLRNVGVSLEQASLWKSPDNNYSGNEDYWSRAAVSSAYEFVQEFPNSSMADDALLVIGELGEKVTRVEALETLLSEYPRTDRKKSARIMLRQAKISLANSEREDGVIAVGLILDEKRAGFLNLWKEVFIVNIVPELLTSNSNLLPGDIILSVDGKEVRDIIDVFAYIRSHEPGETVYFKVKRDGQTIETSAVSHLIPWQ